MFLATILMALREIRRNLMRSSLTMLGVVIGVGAVVALVSIGRGATASVTSSIASMGHNMLTISPGADRRGPPSMGGGGASPFEPADATAIERNVRGLSAVAPTASKSAVLVYGNKNWRANVTGTTTGYLAIRNYTVEHGREMTEADVQSARNVCLIGATTKKELFGTEDAVGARIRIGKLSAEVIGVLKSKGEGGMGQDQDDIVIMPLLAVQRRLTGNHDVAMIYVSVEDGRPTSLVKEQILSLMRERRKVLEGTEDDFAVRDMQELMATMQSATTALTALLGAIAAVSLLVGGIGIMNIMLVSVTERTREIGTRLAIGATGSEVLLQFLVEAVMLSTLGGVVGIGLGLGGSYLASGALKVPFMVVPEIVVVAFVFSATIGVLFGYLPARKAASLNPIEALRHE
jgi:putative ABC transport system permease protein